MEKIIKFENNHKKNNSYQYWMSKTSAERIEAVEIIREHYYSMIGYTETPRIKKIIRFS